MALTVMAGIPGSDTGVRTGRPLLTGGCCIGVCAKLLISNVGMRLGALAGTVGALEGATD